MKRVAKGMRDKPREREGGGVGGGQKDRFDEEYKKGADNIEERKRHKTRSERGGEAVRRKIKP